MPTYEFECNKCAYKFNMLETETRRGRSPDLLWHLIGSRSATDQNPSHQHSDIEPTFLPLIRFRQMTWKRR